MTTTSVPVSGHTVRDGNRILLFDGELLAFVSSREDDRDRWTEIRIFRTQSGTYVLEKIGCSVRLHVPGCSDMQRDLPLFEQIHIGEDPENSAYSWCEICSPAIGEEYDITTLLCEKNRHWATVSTSPADIIEALWRKREGYRRLPYISVQLLERLCLVDPAFEIWRTEKIS